MSTPAKPLYDSIAARIAGDPAFLGLATFLQVVPIIANYDPSTTLVAGSLTLGSGTLAPIAATVVPVTGIDPASGLPKILVEPPAGGWTWAYDGVTPAPPVSIFGYACLDAATGLVLMGVTAKLSTPLILGGAALVVLPEFSFLLVNPPLT